MRIFKHVDDKNLNSECLYKIKRLGKHMDYFKAHYGGSFESLVELTTSPYFFKFFREYAPAQAGSPLPLTDMSVIDHDFQDFDLLMAFTHDGGSLHSVLQMSPEELGDVYGLINSIFSVPPQVFILKSGLQPSDGTMSMYLSLVSEIVTHFPESIACVISSVPEAERIRMYVNLSSVAKAGKISLDEVCIQKAPSEIFLSTICGDSREAKTNILYSDAIREFADSSKGTEELTKSIYSFYMADAFQKQIEISDTNELVEYLRPRALVWARHLKCPKENVGDFAYQLMASSICTSPNHFNSIDFCPNNLIGLGDNIRLMGLAKTVCDGPMALLIKPEYDCNQILNCLEYLHELVPYFSINNIYEKSGFRHTNAINLLQSIGGHCPGAELAILEQYVEPENVLSLLKAIWNTDSYCKYTPEALVNLMSYYVDRLPLREIDGTTLPLNFLELTSDMKSRARQEFNRAYQENADFKDKFIERIQCLNGLTFEHLDVFGLGPEDIPLLMAKMHHKDRGSMLEDELGI
ncbi:hypothetical protein [Pseudomonas putida]|uniref:Uncharacterized protein n=1 Tax=Pseudomonas putida TaxID=303 RepID=A0A8I1EFR3_PSEPU|nr:hypothetical protein [Pseudomonas putida]MBI6885839.1 hypothetical protein [Pseudomonas putida]